MTTTTLRFAMALALTSIGGCQYYDGCDPDYDRDVDVCIGDCRDEDRFDAGRSGDGGAPECRTHEDCDPGAACVEGECVAIPPTGCADAADCATGEVCVEDTCVPIDDACQFDHDCGAGRSCVDNACRPRCASDAECTAGTACLDGLCRPVAECSDDAECATGERCASGRCLAECTSPDACGPDEVCAAGLCRPDVAPRPFCSADADCNGGHLCVFGVCRTPCPTQTDEECQRWDSQLIRCAESESAQWLCFSRHETNPECTTAADCATGESCIDAICHP